MVQKDEPKRWLRWWEVLKHCETVLDIVVYPIKKTRMPESQLAYWMSLKRNRE